MLSYGFGLDYDFEDGLEATSDVGLSLTTRTRSQTLEFSLGTQIFGDFTDGGSDDFDFRNWFVSSAYTRRGANSALSFSGRYGETDLADEVDTSGPVIVITEDGTLTSTRADARLETGIEGPFGLSLDARYRESDYQDTSDPDLVDETEIGGDVVARFSLSPSLDLRARAGVGRVEEDDATATERETTYAGLGLAGETAGGLSFSGDVLFDRAEVTTSAPSTTTEEGIGIELSVSQARRNGAIGASLASRIDDAGRRTTASVSRDFDTRTGALSFSLGVVDQEDADQLEMIGSVSYETETPAGALSAALSREAASSDGDTVLSTSLELAYAREINAVSGWEAGLDYFATDELGGDTEDLTTARLEYRRDLTREWSMRTGYAYTRDDDGSDSNSVFISIDRDIAFGF